MNSDDKAFTIVMIALFVFGAALMAIGSWADVQKAKYAAPANIEQTK